MLSVPIGDRLQEAAGEWADSRMTDPEDALEQKTEQALLEVEHLVSGAQEVEYEVEGTTIRFQPSDDLQELLEAQADRVGATPAEVLSLHLELFARTFLPSDTKQPDMPGDMPEMGGDNF